ncbi:unnamed protein product [Arabis nemorensis]|uniref:Uncharacterized protein n=1 Tax=Arabis nemorensis TaxID=586526 RepID=A0A565B452_9BRAS|nr:unnamed protein product [Arabis nemorensis]
MGSTRVGGRDLLRLIDGAPDGRWWRLLRPEISMKEVGGLLWARIFVDWACVLGLFGLVMGLQLRPVVLVSYVLGRVFVLLLLARPYYEDWCRWTLSLSFSGVRANVGLGLGYLVIPRSF